MGIRQDPIETPVVLLIFNRPSCTERVFAAIRQAKPSQLLVIADGPRSDRPDDLQKCAAARAIVDRVDWDCEVFKNFSELNLGCGIRPATGISWAFELVDRAIILEDDCIPHPDFFRFCDELLERYRDDERVMHISGNNFWADKYHQEQSYLFSRYTLSWGWATWKRAWQHYDFDLKIWSQMTPKNRHELLKNLLGDEHAAKTWAKIFQDVTDLNLGCWDYQWTLACWLQESLNIVPNVNLVTNVGFDADATHTSSAQTNSVDCPHLSIPATAIDFPLTHPPSVARNIPIDRVIQDICYDYFPKLPKRIRSKLQQLFR
jgi:hypothetical protein